MIVLFPQMKSLDLRWTFDAAQTSGQAASHSPVRCRTPLIDRPAAVSRQKLPKKILIPIIRQTHFAREGGRLARLRPLYRPCS
jgi:hypothetical protein